MAYNGSWWHKKDKNWLPTTAANFNPSYAVGLSLQLIRCWYWCLYSLRQNQHRSRHHWNCCSNSWCSRRSHLQRRRRRIKFRYRRWRRTHCCCRFKHWPNSCWRRQPWTPTAFNHSQRLHRTSHPTRLYTAFTVACVVLPSYYWLCFWICVFFW